MKNPEYLMTDVQVEAEYGIDAGSLRNMRWRGDGPPFIKMGRSCRYRVRDLEAYFESCLVEPTPKMRGE
jgi:hypothetical protein